MLSDRDQGNMMPGGFISHSVLLAAAAEGYPVKNGQQT
jgi:hypothetical protein